MKIKTKVKGYMSFNAVLLCLVALMAGYSLLQIYGSQFSALSASRKALQAQQFAQSEADLLRNTSYDELDAAAHDRQSISGVSGWMSEVSIEAETTINEVPQRLATVKVYRNGTVTAPDFSLKVPLSSASGGSFRPPDYSKPHSIDNFPYICPTDGWLFIYGSCYSARTNPRVFINGNLAWYSTSGNISREEDEVNMTFIYPVSKNDVVTMSRGYGGSSLCFYPPR